MDCCLFYFEFLFSLCSIYPSFTLTLAAFSLLSFKLNCRDTKDESKPCQLPLLDQVFLSSQTLISREIWAKFWAKFERNLRKKKNKISTKSSYFFVYQETADVFRQGLLGGLNISSCQYTSFTGLNVDNLSLNNTSTQCVYTDCNR